ncbi:MAG TPA: DUF3219 family protein [Metabacillus sp.]|nr:DUF3219 family protein [Metabacillus sp.]
MVNEIIINDTPISLTKYEEKTINNLLEISVEFPVTSEEYHAITTLLYKNNFHVKVPEKDLAFPGVIKQYYTSLTNLYKENQLSRFSLQIIEQEK